MTDDLSPGDMAKFTAAKRAISFVEPKMRLGLGTGSTAAWFVKLLAERVKQEQMNLICVPTSDRTTELAESLGIGTTTIDEAGWLDLTVDGADEFDPQMDLIKGGGGALLQEKIVATASDQMIVISDNTKEVAQLGAFPLPVEIVPFGWETTRAIIEESLESFNVMGRNVTLRLDRNDPYVTDCGHYILDLHLRRIASASELARMLNQIPGVVEHGLFVDMADRIVIGYPTGDTRLIDADGENVGEPEAAEDDTPENLFKVSED